MLCTNPSQTSDNQRKECHTQQKIHNNFSTQSKINLHKFKTQHVVKIAASKFFSQARDHSLQPLFCSQVVHHGAL